MLKSNEIREMKFSTKAVGGYRQEEVDVLLDKIEADYEWYERNTRELQGTIARMNQEMENYHQSQDSLQNVLMNAQRLADQIVAEARAKSAQIVAEAQENVDRIAQREKELSASFEEKATQRKAVVKQEIDSALRTAKLKQTAMETAANDAVARQQLLYDKLKLEISAFKSDITRKYREHLELLQRLPDSVPMDPQAIAAAAAAAVDRAPAPESFVPQPEPVQPPVVEPVTPPVAEPVVPPVAEPVFEPIVTPDAEPIVEAFAEPENTVEPSENIDLPQGGFTIQDIFSDSDL